jgi:hypothetical protein
MHKSEVKSRWAESITSVHLAVSRAYHPSPQFGVKRYEH